MRNLNGLYRKGTVIITAIGLVVLTCIAAGAATYYIGPTPSGNASGSDRGNLKALNSAIGAAVPGDVFLLQGGNYGSVTINAGYGTADHWVTYRRDPGTTVDPRGPAWFEDETDVVRPDTAAPGNHVVFMDLNINSRVSSGAAAGHYITLAGISLVNNGISLNQYVAYVNIINCCVFGRLFDDITHHKYPEMTPSGISLYYWDIPASEYHHVLVDSCYFEHLRIGVAINSRCGDEVVFSNSHFYWMQNGAFSLVNADHPNADVRVDGCHLHGGYGIADGAVRGTWSVASAGAAPHSVFVYNGTDPTYYDYVGIRLANLGGVEEVRQIDSLDKSTNTAMVTDPFSAAVSTGDAVWFYDGDHGSVLSLKGSHITVRNNRAHDQGNTGMLYSYITGGHDWLIENNLCYDFGTAPLIDAASSAPGYGMLGNNIIIRHNTIIGTPWSGNQTAVKPGAMWNYGQAMALTLNTGTDTSTIVITNNLLAGRCAIPPSNALHVRNNHLYFDSGHGFNTGTTGHNRNNVIYGGSQDPNWGPYTWEQNSLFEFNTGWFAGCDSFAKTFQPAAHGYNLNAGFRLAVGAKGINAGSTVAGDYSTTDWNGRLRDSSPDVGCDEFQPTGIHTPDHRVSGDSRVLRSAASALYDIRGKALHAPATTSGIYIIRQDGILRKVFYNR
jgi:hypothetical protein